MNMKTYGKLLLVVASAVTLCLSLVAPPQVRGNDKAAANTTTDRAASMDHKFATCLILENQNEVAAARIAAQRSQNPAVKDFANMMMKEHQEFIEKLEKFGGTDLRSRLAAAGQAGQNAVNGDRTAPDAAQTETAPRANRPEGSAVAAGEHGAKFMQIKREIADECRSSTQRELSSKSGIEFDKCYVGMQIGAHMYMVDSLKVLERHASAELRPIIAEGREVAQTHLDHAKKLMKSIDAAPAVRTSATESKTR